jgi:hypothetical protein
MVDNVVEGIQQLDLNKAGLVVKPAEDRMDKAKNFNLSGDPTYLELGTFLDAKDTVNNWCVAKVIGVFHDTASIGITFEGWSNRYDI